MGYIAYVIYSTRTKWAYWFAVFVVELAMVRFVVGAALIAYSGIAPSAGLTNIDDICCDCFWYRSIGAVAQ